MSAGKTCCFNSRVPSGTTQKVSRARHLYRPPGFCRPGGLVRCICTQSQHSRAGLRLCRPYGLTSMICLVPSTHVLSYDCVALRAAGIHVLGPDYAGSSALCRPDGLVRCIAHFPITHVLGRFRCCPRHSGDSRPALTSVPSISGMSVTSGRKSLPRVSRLILAAAMLEAPDPVFGAVCRSTPGSGVLFPNVRREHDSRLGYPISDYFQRLGG